MSCPICTEKYTAKTRKEVKCTDCNNSCCMECFKTYNLAGSFKCMHTECNKNYTFNDICLIVNNKTFTNKLCQVVAEKEFVREQKKLSQFKKLTELEAQKRESNEKIRNINAEIKKIKNYKRKIIQEIDDKILILDRMKYNHQKSYYQTNRKINLLSKDEYKEPTHKNYCSHINCNGLLSKDFVCITCKKETCKKCFKPIEGSEHVCTKEDLETVKMITQDSVQCPNCGMHISKVNGCSQMYCVKYSGGCGTIFNYNTGLEDKSGRVHNPHALQERNQMLEANDCFDYFEHTNILTWRREFNRFSLPKGYIRCFEYSWDNCTRLMWFIESTKKEISKRKLTKGKNFINHQDEVKWFSQFKIAFKKNQFDQKIIKTFEEILILLKTHIENFIEKFKNNSLSLGWINDSQTQLLEIFDKSFCDLRCSLKHYGYRNIHIYIRPNYIYFQELK